MSEEGEEKEKEKTIILIHNQIYKIPVKIKENYDKALVSVKKALYLTEDEMDFLIIYFKDSDGDENMIEESNFDEAFESEVWTTSTISIEYDELKDNEITEEDKNRIINETRENCIKLMVEKIKEKNDKWKGKFNDLIYKFKEELKQREILNQISINNIIKKIANDAKERIKNKVENYNKNIDGIIKSKIRESVAGLTKEKNEFIENKKEIEKSLKEIEDNIDYLQINFKIP